MWVCVLSHVRVFNFLHTHSLCSVLAVCTHGATLNFANHQSWNSCTTWTLIKNNKWQRGGGGDTLLHECAKIKFQTVRIMYVYLWVESNRKCQEEKNTFLRDVSVTLTSFVIVMNIIRGLHAYSKLMWILYMDDVGCLVDVSGMLTDSTFITTK
jgi:hypothetical protein